MLKLNVRMDIVRARASLKGLEQEVNKAAARALERTATTARKEANEEIRKALNVRARIIRNLLEIVRPYGRNSLIRDIVASGDPIPLRDFAARMTRKGATFQVKRGGGRKTYRREGRTGFLVDRFGKHVFVRHTPDPPGPERARVKKVYGPSVPQYFVSRFVRERMIAAAARRWPIEFERELAFRRARALG